MQFPSRVLGGGGEEHESSNGHFECSVRLSTGDIGSAEGAVNVIISKGGACAIIVE